MAFDREDTLKKAEKFLRQGRLDAAIAEYVRVVEDQPRDWNTANALGDLYGRAGQTDKAAAQYARIAEHLMREGFYPKAGALYKKLLKLNPEDEACQMQLAEISAKQGLLVDAKAYLNAVAGRRRARGDRAGVAEIVVRLGTLDPSDVDARMAAALAIAEMGDEDTAALRYRAIHDDLAEKGRTQDALVALREAVRLNPYDREGRGILARASVSAGDLDAARGYLDRETAGDDPSLLMALAEIELRSGHIDQGRTLLPDLLARDRGLRTRIVEMGWSLAADNQEAAFECINAVVDAGVSANEFDDAAAVLQEFATRVPQNIPALLKLVEVCVDGGLETTMYEAQTQLADAYLEAGQAAEARVIAEDLVAREPWERAHIERFRRALVMLHVADPDTLIAERLSGQAPFMATDLFADLNVPEPQTDKRPPDEIAEEAAATTAREDLADPAGDQTFEPGVPATAPSTAVAPPAKRAGMNRQEPSTVEIDLTSVLGDLDGSDSEVERAREKLGEGKEVLQDFRQGVSRQSGADHSAQHMTIARTYLEMGLSDEAMPALRTAARSPRFRFEAASVLARLYKQRGEAANAIEWFERAAEAPAPGPDEGRALLYDLGTTLEAAGESARALAVFLELQAEAGDYRDVAARANRLARVQSGG